MPINFIVYSILLGSAFTAGFFWTKDMQDIVLEAFGLRIQLRPIAALALFLTAQSVFYALCKLLYVILNFPEYIKKRRYILNLQKNNDNLMRLIIALQCKAKDDIARYAKALYATAQVDYFSYYIKYFLSTLGDNSKDQKALLLAMLPYNETLNFALKELVNLMISDKQYDNALVYANKLYELLPSEDSCELLLQSYISAEKWQDLEKLLSVSAVNKFLNKAHLAMYRDMVKEKLAKIM